MMHRGATTIGCVMYIMNAAGRLFQIFIATGPIKSVHSDFQSIEQF